MSDNVNSPAHYNQGAIECIDAIWESGNGRGYCIGNAIKYLWRAGLKGEETEDIAKAAFYLRYLLSKLSSEHPDPRTEVKTEDPKWSADDEKGRVWIYVKEDTDVSAYPEGYLLEVKYGVEIGQLVLSIPPCNNPGGVCAELGSPRGMRIWGCGRPERVIRRL